MIIKRHNKDDFVYAIFEWDIVQKNGRPDPDGQYMYVRDIWVHKSKKGNIEILKFIIDLDKDPKNMNIKWIYWQRSKNGKKAFRLSKLFSRRRCVSQANKFLLRLQEA